MSQTTTYDSSCLSKISDPNFKKIFKTEFERKIYRNMTM